MSIAWKGVMPAVTTKFTANDQLDLVLFEKNIQAQLAAGVHGLVLGGTLGEASTLAPEEKRTLTQTTVNLANGKVPVLMNIAEQSTKGAFPDDFLRSVGNAELAGVLDEDFVRWTEYYRLTAIELVERLADWAPKLFYWAVMLVVAFIIIKMALGYQGLILNWSEQLK